MNVASRAIAKVNRTVAALKSSPTLALTIPAVKHQARLIFAPAAGGVHSLLSNATEAAMAAARRKSAPMPVSPSVGADVPATTFPSQTPSTSPSLDTPATTPAPSSGSVGAPGGSFAAADASGFPLVADSFSPLTASAPSPATGTDTGSAAGGSMLPLLAAVFVAWLVLRKG